MAQMPGQPEAFAQRVRQILRGMKPQLAVDLTGPSELLVNGRRLDLENLMRLVATDTDRGSEIVEQYLRHLFDEDTLTIGTMPWEVARGKIMPRIQPRSIFEHLSEEMVAHVPYVNDTAIVFVIDMPNMTVSVTTEQMVRWGIRDAAELEEIARENLDRYTPELELRCMEAEDGGRAIVVAQQDGYDASRLLLDTLRETLGPQLGGDFLVGTPSRDMFVAVSRGPSAFVERVQDRIANDFRRLPYPITSRMFYVTFDGVAGTDRQAA